MPLTNEEIEIIAKTIGHHFWECQTDNEAAFLGSDVAGKIVKELSKEVDKGD